MRCYVLNNYCILPREQFSALNYKMLKDRGSNQSYKPNTNTAWVRTQKMGAFNSQPQVIKLTSCLPRVCGSLQLPPPPNWSPRHSWNIAESCAKHKKFQILLIHISIISVFSRTFDNEFHNMKTNGMKPWGKNKRGGLRVLRIPWKAVFQSIVPQVQG